MAHRESIQYLIGSVSCSVVSDSLWPMVCNSSGSSVHGILQARILEWVQFSSVIQSCPTLRPHELQHARPPCPSPTPRVHPNSRPSSRWCHAAISSSVIPFSSCPQSLPASESFPMSQLFAWGGQSTGVSALASVLPMNTEDWSPLEWTGWISLHSKGLSRVFSNTAVQKAYSFSRGSSQPRNWTWVSYITGRFFTIWATKEANYIC